MRATILIMLVAICNAMAQAPKMNVSKPVLDTSQASQGSQIEAALIKRGVIILKKFTKIGKVKSQGDVEINVLSIKQEGLKAQFGLHIRVSGANRYDQGSIVFLDRDELTSFVHVLEKMINDGPELNNENGSSELIWTARGGFSFTVFRGEEGSVHGAIEAKTSTCFMTFQDIKDLLAIVTKADQFIASKA